MMETIFDKDDIFHVDVLRHYCTKEAWVLSNKE